MSLNFVDSSTITCLTPLADGVVTGKKVAVHLLTNGRCRDCLVWDVDGPCRIEKPIWSETTVTTAVLPWRAASNAYVPPARKRAAYHTDASASCEEKQVDATDEKTTGGKTTCPRP